MSYVNKAILVGNVGGDPEIKTFESGKLATFTLATTKVYTDRTGARQQKTIWHSIVVGGSTADVVERFVRKGDPLYVEGEIDERTYVNRDNQQVKVKEIRATTIQLLKPREQAQPASPQQPAYPSQRPAYSQQAPAWPSAPQSQERPKTPFGDDDLGF